MAASKESASSTSRATKSAAVPIRFGALFGWFHPPGGSSGGTKQRSSGVVLCNPIGDDYVRSHRAFRHLAERLARAGFSVLRFDFHGTGDSLGHEREPDRVSTWLGDIHRAIEELKARSGVKEVTLVGLRLGATIAALAAEARTDVGSVVLWGACPTGQSFVSDTTRIHKMHRMLEPESFAAGPAAYDEGEEALGFFLTNETVNELAKLDLMRASLRPAVKALVIGTGNVPTEDALLRHLRSLFCEVTYKHLPGHKFLISIPHHSPLPDAVLDEIVTWLDVTYPALEVRPPIAAPPEGREFAEEPLFLREPRRLFGILSRPRREKRRSDAPAIIMLNAGCVHRIGPHRHYVAMARRWADLGFHVLRLDLSGIGDSPVADGAKENVCYPPSGQEDVRDAMTFLREKIGTERFVLAGLCSGGDIAFQLGFKDPRVVGTVIMNPRTFCVHDLEMVEVYKRARWYQDSLLKKEKWIKLLKGEVDVRHAVRMLAPRVKGAALRTMKELLDRVRPKLASAAAKDAEITDVPACLRTMAERGVDTLLIASENDPGVDYVDAHFKKGMRALEAVANFRREDLKGTDHTFTSVWSQDFVTETITDHLTRRHLGRSGPA